MSITQSPSELRAARPGVLVAALAVLVASATNARAQDNDPRVQDARKACLAGDVAKGVGLLADLYAETKDPVWIFNVGRCYQQNGQDASALSRFREFLRKQEAGTRPDVIKRAEGFVAELEQKLRPAPSVGSVARAGDDSPGPASAVTGIGATTSGPRLSDNGTTPSWSWRKKVGLASLAAGGASLVLAVVFHVSREFRAHDFIDAGCGTNDLSIGDCARLQARVKSAETVMFVGYGGAVALGGLGAYLLWATGRGDATSLAAPVGTKLACAPQGDVAGVVCGGRF